MGTAVEEQARGQTAAADEDDDGAAAAAQPQPPSPSPGLPDRVRERLVRPLPADRLWGWLGPLLVTLFAGVLRFWQLGQPRAIIFDETYYAKDALALLRFGHERNTVPDNPSVAGDDGSSMLLAGDTDIFVQGGSFIVHPPVGKWLIAAGEQMFGVTPFGWRFGAAVAGTLSVLLLARVARRMTGSTLLGCLAGLLLSLDALHFVQSRAAMLDIFLLLFIVAAFACLVADRDDGRRRLAERLSDGRAWADTAAGPRLGVRWWRVGAGVCLGLAVASKWSGLYFVAAFGLLAFAWDVGARRTAGMSRPTLAAVKRDVLALSAAFLLVPLVVYVGSWAGWFRSDGGYDRQWAATRDTTWFLIPDALRALWHYHVEMYAFHRELNLPHDYQSRPVQWHVLARPVAYFYESPVQGQNGCEVMSCSREVLGVGTPAVWWAGLLALASSVWLWVSRRDWRAATIIVVFVVATAPWLLQDLQAERRTMFMFYALPTLPFLILALTLAAGWALGGSAASRRRRQWGAIAVGGYVALVVLNLFGLPLVDGLGLYPVLVGETIPYDVWRAKMWFPSWI